MTEKAMKLIKKGIKGKDFTLELLMRGTTHGFRAKEFQQRVCGKFPTLSIIKSEHGNIFGGFLTKPWSKGARNSQIKDKKAFLYSVDNNGILRPNSDASRSIAITNDTKTLCRYGGGIKDLYIADKCNSNTKSTSRLFNFGPKPSKEGVDSAGSDDEAKSVALSDDESKSDKDSDSSSGSTSDSDFDEHRRNSYLAGASSFKVVEIEIFKVKF